MDVDRRMLGLVLVAGASALWSTAGIFVRMVDLDIWTVLGWRSVFAVLALLVIVALRPPPRGDRPPLPALWLVVPVAAVSMGAYVAALMLTTVANVMVVYASVPLVTAGLAFFFLGEAITGRMVAASLAAIAGVAIMAGGALQPGHVLGIAVALAMTLAMGLQIVLARRFPGLDMALVNACAAALCAALGLALAATPLPGLTELLWLAGFGISNTAIAYWLLLLGARHLPAGEAGLVSSLEVVLGPLWVWMLFAEIPSGGAFVGGALVLVAVVSYLLAEAALPSVRPAPPAG